MSVIYEKPKCPEHPNTGVSNAKQVSTGNRVWICLMCGKNLGEAPPHEPTWEKQVIDGKKK